MVTVVVTPVRARAVEYCRFRAITSHIIQPYLIHTQTLNIGERGIKQYLIHTQTLKEHGTLERGESNSI